MWHQVNQCAVLDILKDHSVFIFRVKQPLGLRDPDDEKATHYERSRQKRTRRLWNGHLCKPFFALDMFAYLYVCVPICLRIYMFAYLYVCVPMFAYLYVCVPMFAYLYVCVPICLHTYMFAYLYVCIPICLHTYMFAYLVISHYSSSSFAMRSITNNRHLVGTVRVERNCGFISCYVPQHHWRKNAYQQGWTPSPPSWTPTVPPSGCPREGQQIHSILQ
jgi:hypothetical protein